MYSHSGKVSSVEFSLSHIDFVIQPSSHTTQNMQYASSFGHANDDSSDIVIIGPKVRAMNIVVLAAVGTVDVSIITERIVAGAKAIEDAQTSSRTGDDLYRNHLLAGC